MSSDRDQAIIDRWRQGFSSSQIAQALGLSKGTVANIACRLRKEGVDLERRHAVHFHPEGCSCDACSDGKKYQRCRDKYPERYRARTAVNNAVASGRLIKGPCEQEGLNCKGKIEGHHDDYSRPLGCALALQQASSGGRAMRLGVVMPIGQGRQENVALALDHLMKQTHPVEQVVAVLDGLEVELPALVDDGFQVLRVKKHQPGKEQPRNEGVRLMRHICPDVTHVAFLDSDIIVAEDWHRTILDAYDQGHEQRIMVCPYEWMPQGSRRIMTTLHNDPRQPQFRITHPDEVFLGDLSAGLACFSGNLVWPIDEFVRVGGFWSQIHHGRCEDGELGLRAVAMGVPISFCAAARGWHLWHPINTSLALERNERDVPMLNNRHPWVEGAGVFLVDRDGKAFDVHCSGCNQSVPTIQWWEHATECAVPFELKVGD